MSACNVLLDKRRRTVHMAVDGAGYDADGIVQSISQKAFALPTLHAAVSALGVGMAGQLFAIQLERRFSSFDGMIDGLEVAAPSIYASLLSVGVGPITDVIVTIIGWSARDAGPAHLTMRLTEPDVEKLWAERNARHNAEFGGGVVDAQPFKLVRHDYSTINPPPFRSMLEIGFPSYDFDEDIGEAADPEIDMLHFLEAQRRRKFATRPGCVEAYKIGGLALLTSVTASGVTQKVLHRWTEDRIGQPISPIPINDWVAWRATRDSGSLRLQPRPEDNSSFMPGSSLIGDM